MLPDKTDIGIRQLQYRFNPHGLQLFTNTAPDSPDLIHRKQSHQLPLPFQIRQIHHSSGLSLPLFRRVIGQLCQGFSLGYADTDREVRPAQNRLANFPAKVGKVATVTNTSKIAKSLINTVNFAAWREFLQRCHHSVGHIGIKLIVAAKRDNTVPAKHVLLLEIRLTHFDEGLSLLRTGDHAAVVV